MLTKVQKWGNSLGLRIPRSLAADAKVQPGSMVDISPRGFPAIEVFGGHRACAGDGPADEPLIPHDPRS